eukprot:m.359052 g.359052  ORF g.359052 m.359052 type:complete len:443 (-) comp16625_c0_seq2:885-2213(-)
MRMLPLRTRVAGQSRRLLVTAWVLTTLGALGEARSITGGRAQRRKVTSPVEAAAVCPGVRVVYNKSTTTEHPRRRLAPPRSADMARLCKTTLKHWDYCVRGMEAVTRRNPITTRNIITEWTDTYIDDGSCHEAIVGYPFTDRCVGMFQWSWYCPTRLPDFLHKKTVHRHDRLGSTLQVYPTASGHYPAEQFPVLIRMLQELPSDVKILTGLNGCPLCEKYVAELLRLGVLSSRNRLVSWEGRGHVYHAETVYHHRPFPWENGKRSDRGAVLRGSADLDLVRATILGGSPGRVTPRALNKIVLIARAPGTSRAASNHATLLRVLQSRFGKVVVFDSPAPTLQEDVAVFRDAGVVVGVHGAGLMNLMWCAPGAAVVEVCYTSGMPCPAIYATMAASLQLDYHVSVGTGDYSGEVLVNIADVVTRIESALGPQPQESAETPGNLD